MRSEADIAAEVAMLPCSQRLALIFSILRSLVDSEDFLELYGAEVIRTAELLIEEFEDMVSAAGG